ncbi:hypothetical protein EJB05_30956, partial [Eragrostis curvula]
MGKGKKSCFASLFGLTQQSADGRQPEAPAAVGRPQQRYYQGTRVRPTDDAGNDNYNSCYGYADRDIDRKASEFIERIA